MSELNNLELQNDVISKSADREKSAEENMENLFQNVQICLSEKENQNKETIQGAEALAQECSILSEKSPEFNNNFVSILDQYLQTRNA